MNTDSIDWNALQELATVLGQPGNSPGHVSGVELGVLENAFESLRTHEDWRGVVRLRQLLTPVLARDTATGIPLMRRISHEAIVAAEKIGDTKELAHLLGAEGHNLHRMGYHRQAIDAFDRSARRYQEGGETFEALKSYFMTALCYRALGDRQRAKRILNQVLDQAGADDPWRGEPLQVLAWITQDEGDLWQAEHLLREAIRFQERGRDPDILVAGGLADLGELVGLQGHTAEAEEIFQRSLGILAKYEGQYNRQEARTRLKLADTLRLKGEYERALRLLDEADDRIRSYGHYYDLFWRIELTRALIFLKQQQWAKAAHKFRLVLRFRRELKLPITLLMKQYLSRLRAGTGLPR